MTPFILPLSLLLAVVQCVIAAGPAAVNFGNATSFAVLSKTGVSTVPTSLITGNVGVSPAAVTFLTGFSLTLVTDGTSATSAQVMGQLLAASLADPTPALLTSAIDDMQAAFVDAMGRPDPTAARLHGGSIGGLTIPPGIYKWGTGVDVDKDLTFNGTSADTWIFQIAGSLVVGNSIKCVLTGGALAKNIVWAVAGTIVAGTSSHVEGTLLGQAGITMQTSSSITGRVLAQTMVALQQTTVNVPE